METNTKFAESLDLDYPILSDPKREATSAYGLTKGKSGNASRKTIFVGKDGKILHIEDSVKTKEHGTQIAARLAELGVEKK